MKIKFLNIPIDSLTMEQTLHKIDTSIYAKNQIHHVVVNAGKIVMMQKDKELEKSVLSADLINADGQSVVWAAKLLGVYIPERVAGIDLMNNLVNLAHIKGYKCFFFGAKNDIVKKVVNKYVLQYSQDIIGGYRNGYYSEEDESLIADSISKSNAQILFVAISSPKKEIFLKKYKKKLKNINFIMGVGGSFDVVAGKVKRAPFWMQKIGMEWFYRFIQEPKRMWKRYFFGNIAFIKLIFKNYFKL